MSQDRDWLKPVKQPQNYKPEVIKNYRPATAPTPQPGHGVDNNYVPTTDSSAPSSPPPKPKK